MSEGHSIFDYLQQMQRDSFDFSFNYSITLKMAGHQMESLLYLGNALRMNESCNLPEFLKVESVWEENIISLVCRQKKKHYVFLNLQNPSSKNMKGYYGSIAIMLRNLGNTVTVVELSGNRILAGEWNQNVKSIILNQILSSAERQDKVFNWDICKYQLYTVEVNGRQMLSIADILPYLAKENEDVILLTHFVEGVRNAGYIYPLIFLDAISAWDDQKGLVDSYNDKNWDEIYQYADKVITEKELPHKWSGKKVSPFESANKTGENEICFEEERITELNHYMRNEEMFCGVFSVLKAVEEIESERNKPL